MLNILDSEKYLLELEAEYREAKENFENQKKFLIKTIKEYTNRDIDIIFISSKMIIDYNGLGFEGVRTFFNYIKSKRN